MTYTRRPRPRVEAPPDDPTWDTVYTAAGTPLYYSPHGQPCSLRQWAEAFENRRQKFVGRDYVLGAWVATIWDGINHDLGMFGPPLIFETTVFRKDRFGTRRSGRELPACLDKLQENYPSKREAQMGHWRIRKMARKVQQRLNGPPPLAVTVKRRRRR